MYSRTKPTVYAVYWPEINVFKVGFSEHQRWRMFVLRGAKILGLLDNFDSFSQALNFEDACHLALWPTCRPGFSSAKEAAPYLGASGGGYVECFRVPGDLMPSEILLFIDTQLEVLHAQA